MPHLHVHGIVFCSLWCNSPLPNDCRIKMFMNLLHIYQSVVAIAWGGGGGGGGGHHLRTFVWCDI